MIKLVSVISYCSIGLLLLFLSCFLALESISLWLDGMVGLKFASIVLCSLMSMLGANLARVIVFMDFGWKS